MNKADLNRIVILGSSGQLGTALNQVLTGPDISVAPLTRIDFDADSDDPFDKLADYSTCDYLINCIVYHKVDKCEHNVDKSFRINSELVFNLAKFCAKNDITFIHVSTDYVFDGLSQTAYTETDLPSPLNVYGASKLAGESFVKAYAPKHFIFRVSSLYGRSPSSDPGVNFVQKMIHAAKEKQSLRVIDNQIMSPTYTGDVALAMKTFIERGVTDYGLYHACNSGECSWFEFARRIFDLTGLDADLTPISYDQYHTGARRPQFCSMDNSKLSRHHTMRPWPEALAEYLSQKEYL